MSGRLIRIYCDGNNGIDETRFDLGCVGSMANIERHVDSLKDGQRVIFYETDSWEAEGTIHFDKERNRWFGIPELVRSRQIGPASNDEDRPESSSRSPGR